MNNFNVPKHLKTHCFLGLLAMCFCLYSNTIMAQCNPDLTPPDIICPANVTATVGTGQCEVPMFLADALANDACGSVTVVNNGGFWFPLGNTIVEYTATDEAQNTATCSMMVSVSGGIPSAIYCRPGPYKIADTDGSTTILPADVMYNPNDFYCTTLELSIGAAGPKLPTLEIAGLGDVEVYCWAGVLGGGYMSCSTTLSLVASVPGTSTFHFPAWHSPNDPIIDSLTVTSLGTEFWESWFDEAHVMDNCAAKVIKTLRQYSILNWMDGNFDETPISAMDFDNDGTPDSFEAQLFGDSLYLMLNGVKDKAIAPRSGLYRYGQIIKYPYPEVPQNIQGTVFSDDNQNCSPDGNELGMGGWLVKVIGHPSGNLFWDTTDVNGNYEIGVCVMDTSAEISLDLPYNYGGTCPVVYQIATPPTGQTVTQNIPVQLEQNCSILSVDLSAAEVSPCLPGKYLVSYCNLSNATISDAKIEVELDHYLELTGASLTASPLGGNKYEFLVGNLPAGYCGEFDIQYYTQCGAPLGAVHCSEANISPVAVCDNNGTWFGAWLEANAICDGDSVRLTLTNIGQAAMGESLEFVVVEDLIMYLQLPFLLGPGESTEIVIPANGSTFHIQAPQVSGHPFGGLVAAQVEGCGGLNLPGASLVLPVGSNNPFRSTDCLANSLNLQSNYMSAVPTGYGAQHLIEKNTDIEYSIHFQNVGTDTASNIEVLVELPTELDITSVLPGAGSHHFDYDVLIGNLLRFRFDDIHLPDSATNFLASQGFVSYRVKQQADLSEGTIITTRAQITAMNQIPFLTDHVQHKIGSDFITVETDEATALSGDLKIFPNPSAGAVYFEWKQQMTEARFSLRDALGALVRQQTFSGNKLRFEPNGIGSGVYFFQVGTQAGMQYSGRIILK